MSQLDFGVGALSLFWKKFFVLGIGWNLANSGIIGVGNAQNGWAEVGGVYILNGGSSMSRRFSGLEEEIRLFID